jgi:hypothetical protein
MDNAGYHNQNLELSTARISRAGTWKKQRVVAIIPAGPMIPTKVALAMRTVVFPPNQAAHWIGAVGHEVGEAYSSTIEAVLSHPELSQWEFILTFEHDNLPPPEGLVKLIESMEQHPELSCIGGLYWTKGVDGVPQIWGDPNDTINFRPQRPREGEVVECVGTGMGFNLWRIAMFKDARLRKPWFKTVAGAEGVGTQDLYFWSDARKYGYRCGVDCRVLVGHYDVATDTVW